MTTLFAPTDGSSAPVSNVAYLGLAGSGLRSAPPGLLHTFHVVRLDSGELLALSARDPHLGCTVPYRPSFQYDGRAGWFRNPCHGETYDLAGYRVFGPQPSGLDRFHVEVVDARVIVDLSRLEPGPTAIPPGYEFETGGVPGPLNTPRSLPVAPATGVAADVRTASRAASSPDTEQHAQGRDGRR